MINSQAIQITSNEIAQPILDLVVQAATQHKLEVKISDPVSFNAPFCGDEYFTQEIQLHSDFETRTHADFENCLLDIETIVERELSEGFVDAQQ